MRKPLKGFTYNTSFRFLFVFLSTRNRNLYKSSHESLLLVQKSGTITYNGHKLNDFFVQRASAYISQTDSHIAELTVRETLDFAARCQGSSEGFSGAHNCKIFFSSYDN